VIRKLTYYLFLLVFAAGMPVCAQSFKAMAKFDTNAMLIGDQVKLDISFSYPSKTLVRWPIIGDTILKSFQVINRTKIDTSLSPDKKKVTLHQKFLITNFDSGFYIIPPFRFFYQQPPDTTIRFTQTETLLLSIHTMAVDTTKVIKPIKGPLKIPLTFREILPWLLLTVLAILVVFALLFYLKKRKKAEPVFQIRSRGQLLPHEMALSELEKIRARKLWQEGRIKEYHSELTDVLRKYIENRFSIIALEMTTLEILDAIDTQKVMNKGSYEKLSYILTLADLVKFAKMRPLSAENELSMENAIAIVLDTAVKKEQSVSNV
jgi:hypothetical protein